MRGAGEGAAIVTVEDRQARLRTGDVPIVKYAVLELGLLIVGRRRWGAACPACQRVLRREEWRQHRCDRKAYAATGRESA